MKQEVQPFAVAPLVGAWIEMPSVFRGVLAAIVAPLVGAWIEIREAVRKIFKENPSLPLWERGLKSEEIKEIFRSNSVAPLVGAWIEIVFPNR